MASSTIFHIDMDAFFASVEQLDNPSLRGRCVVVGGPSNRGVVAAASYEARRYGIHSAMPIFQAKQRCRDLIIAPPRRKRYAAVSHRIMTLLGSFSPVVEPVSIDEAYLDATGCLRAHGTSRGLAEAIKRVIRQEVGLTCSVGVAPNKFLSKIASDLQKPDGLTVIEPEQVTAFISRLDVAKVPGVGQRARAVLAFLGVSTLGQVNTLPPDILKSKLGKFGHRLSALAQGRDDSPVGGDSPVKSISSETTFEQNTKDRAVLEGHLLSQAQRVAYQLRKADVIARTITVKIKTADFKQHTRSKTLPAPVFSSEAIFKIARELLAGFALKMRVRLVGVGVGGLLDAGTPTQAALFPEADACDCRKWAQVDRAMDAISKRFGGEAVVRGSLVSQDDGKQETVARPPDKHKSG